MITKKPLSQKSLKTKTSPIPQYSLKDKKVARDLTITDLINSLKKLKSGESLRFGSLGNFSKTKQKIKIKSKLLSKGHGNTYLYYRVGFRASSILKRELDK
jgi:nucleoid DNA-binding protein